MGKTKLVLILIAFMGTTACSKKNGVNEDGSCTQELTNDIIEMYTTPSYQKFKDEQARIEEELENELAELKSKEAEQEESPYYQAQDFAPAARYTPRTNRYNQMNRAAALNPYQAYAMELMNQSYQRQTTQYQDKYEQLADQNLQQTQQQYQQGYNSITKDVRNPVITSSDADSAHADSCMDASYILDKSETILDEYENDTRCMYETPQGHRQYYNSESLDSQMNELRDMFDEDC